MPTKVDYKAIAVPVIEELIGVAFSFVPVHTAEKVKFTQDMEFAEANSERLKMARQLINEAKDSVTCPACAKKLEEVNKSLEGTEREVLTLERVTRLKTDLKELLEEYKGDFAMLDQTSLPEESENAIQSSTMQQAIPERSIEQHETAQSNTNRQGFEPAGKPESGKTFPGQTDTGYCLECVEGHTMIGKTEMRHAIDRFRTSGKMTEGVVEKVGTAIEEVSGIVKDVEHLKEAPPEVKKGLEEILDEARWIRKEYGISGKGLTIGKGSMEDLEELRTKISDMQAKAYSLIGKCPVCLKKINK